MPREPGGGGRGGRPPGGKEPPKKKRRTPAEIGLRIANLSKFGIKTEEDLKRADALAKRLHFKEFEAMKAAEERAHNLGFKTLGEAMVAAKRAKSLGFKTLDALVGAENEAKKQGFRSVEQLLGRGAEGKGDFRDAERFYKLGGLTADLVGLNLKRAKLAKSPAEKARRYEEAVGDSVMVPSLKGGKIVKHSITWLLLQKNPTAMQYVKKHLSVLEGLRKQFKDAGIPLPVEIESLIRTEGGKRKALEFMQMEMYSDAAKVYVDLNMWDEALFCHKLAGNLERVASIALSHNRDKITAALFRKGGKERQAVLKTLSTMSGADYNRHAGRLKRVGINEEALTRAVNEFKGIAPGQPHKPKQKRAEPAPKPAPEPAAEKKPAAAAPPKPAAAKPAAKPPPVAKKLPEAKPAVPSKEPPRVMSEVAPGVKLWKPPEAAAKAPPTKPKAGPPTPAPTAKAPAVPARPAAPPPPKKRKRLYAKPVLRGALTRYSSIRNFIVDHVDRNDLKPVARLLLKARSRRDTVLGNEIITVLAKRYKGAKYLPAIDAIAREMKIPAQELRDLVKDRVDTLISEARAEAARRREARAEAKMRKRVEEVAMKERARIETEQKKAKTAAEKEVRRKEEERKRKEQEAHEERLKEIREAEEKRKAAEERKREMERKKAQEVAEGDRHKKEVAEAKARAEEGRLKADRDGFVEDLGLADSVEAGAELAATKMRQRRHDLAAHVFVALKGDPRADYVLYALRKLPKTHRNSLVYAIVAEHARFGKSIRAARVRLQLLSAERALAKAEERAARPAIPKPVAELGAAERAREVVGAAAGRFGGVVDRFRRAQKPLAEIPQAEAAKPKPAAAKPAEVAEPEIARHVGVAEPEMARKPAEPEKHVPEAELPTAADAAIRELDLKSAADAEKAGEFGNALELRAKHGDFRNISKMLLDERSMRATAAFIDAHPEIISEVKTAMDTLVTNPAEVVDDALRQIKLAREADHYINLGRYSKAAGLYEEAGQYEEALAAHVKVNNHQKMAELAISKLTHHIPVYWENPNVRPHMVEFVHNQPPMEKKLVSALKEADYRDAEDLVAKEIAAQEEKIEGAKPEEISAPEPPVEAPKVEPPAEAPPLEPPATAERPPAERPPAERLPAEKAPPEPPPEAPPEALITEVPKSLRGLMDVIERGDAAGFAAAYINPNANIRRTALRAFRKMPPTSAFIAEVAEHVGMEPGALSESISKASAEIARGIEEKRDRARVKKSQNELDGKDPQRQVATLQTLLADGDFRLLALLDRAYHPQIVSAIEASGTYLARYLTAYTNALHGLTGEPIERITLEIQAEIDALRERREGAARLEVEREAGEKEHAKLLELVADPQRNPGQLRTIMRDMDDHNGWNYDFMGALKRADSHAAIADFIAMEYKVTPEVANSVLDRMISDYAAGEKPFGAFAELGRAARVEVAAEEREAEPGRAAAEAPGETVPPELPEEPVPPVREARPERDRFKGIDDIADLPEFEDVPREPAEPFEIPTERPRARAAAAELHPAAAAKKLGLLSSKLALLESAGLELKGHIPKPLHAIAAEPELVRAADLAANGLAVDSAEIYAEHHQFGEIAKLANAERDPIVAAQLFVMAGRPEQAARKYLEGGDPEAAKEHLNERSKEHAELWGRAQETLGEFLEAAESYIFAGKIREAKRIRNKLERIGDYKWAAVIDSLLGDNYNKARMYEREGDYEGAFKLFVGLKRKGKKNARKIIKQLGETKKYDKAADLLVYWARSPKIKFKTASRLFAEAAKYKAQLAKPAEAADLYRNAGNVKKAIDYYNIAAEHDPEMHGKAAGLLEQKGEVKAAAEQYEHAGITIFSQEALLRAKLSLGELPEEESMLVEGRLEKHEKKRTELFRKAGALYTRGKRTKMQAAECYAMAGNFIEVFDLCQQKKIKPKRKKRDETPEQTARRIMNDAIKSLPGKKARKEYRAITGRQSVTRWAYARSHVDDAKWAGANKALAQELRAEFDILQPTSVDAAYTEAAEREKRIGNEAKAAVYYLHIGDTASLRRAELLIGGLPAARAARAWELAYNMSKDLRLEVHEIDAVEWLRRAAELYYEGEYLDRANGLFEKYRKTLEKDFGLAEKKIAEQKAEIDSLPEGPEKVSEQEKIERDEQELSDAKKRDLKYPEHFKAHLAELDKKFDTAALIYASLGKDFEAEVKSCIKNIKRSGDYPAFEGLVRSAEERYDQISGEMATTGLPAAEKKERFKVFLDTLRPEFAEFLLSQHRYRESAAQYSRLGNAGGVERAAKRAEESNHLYEAIKCHEIAAKLYRHGYPSESYEQHRAAGALAERIGLLSLAEEHYLEADDMPSRAMVQVKKADRKRSIEIERRAEIGVGMLESQLETEHERRTVLEDKIAELEEAEADAPGTNQKVIESLNDELARVNEGIIDLEMLIEKEGYEELRTLRELSSAERIEHYSGAGIYFSGMGDHARSAYCSRQAGILMRDTGQPHWETSIRSAMQEYAQTAGNHPKYAVDGIATCHELLGNYEGAVRVRAALNEIKKSPAVLEELLA